MTGEELYRKLSEMTKEERKREVIIEDYSGVTAQFSVLDKDVTLEEGRVDSCNDPDKILEKDFISIKAGACYFLG